jgi:hypothetical protein
LFAVQYGSIAISEDAGCSWRYHEETLQGENFWLDHSAPISWVNAGSGVVYIHDVQNNIIRVTEDSIERHYFRLSKGDGGSKWLSFRGMTTVTGSTDELVALSAYGDFLESFDGGETWTLRGGSLEPGESNGLGNNAIAHFNPSNPDEVIVPIGSSVRVTADGGDTWDVGVFHTEFDGPFLLSGLAPSPTNFDVVWALVLQMEPGLPIGQQTFLYRSEDGGLNFDIVMKGTEVTMDLTSLVKPVPQRDHECLLIGGTDVVRVNGIARKASIHPLEGEVVSATFSPADNEVLYLGFNALSYWGLQ